jgi:hypothetical protein
MHTKKLVRAALAVVFVLGLSGHVLAYTFPWEHISGHRSSPPYGWNYSYDIGFYNDTLMIDVDVRLTGFDAGETLKGRWESGIESLWSTDRLEVPIAFNVDWVTADFDQTVIVANSTARWDMTHWYTIGAGGWGDAYQEKVAAHEFGHMISMYDEYTGGAIDPVTKRVDTGGVMCTLNGGTLDYYYDPFLDWYHEKLESIPEPTSLQLLLGGGFVALLAIRRRMKRQEICS